MRGPPMSDKVVLDHTIVSVNDVHETIEFWSKVLGFKGEGEAGPFTVLRISAELTFQMAP